MRQVIVGGHADDVLSTSATEYNYIYGTESQTWFVTETARRETIPGNGVIHSLKVYLSAAPGGGGSYVFTIRRGLAATALTVTVTDPNTSAQSNAEATIAVDAGWTIECAPSGSPTATPSAQWSFIVEDTDEINRSWLTGGHTNLMPTAVTERNTVGGGDVWAVPLAGRNGFAIPFPLSGTIKNFYVRLNAAPGAGTSYTISINDSSAALLSVTISGTATSGNDTGSAAIAIGSTIHMRSNPAGIPTARFLFWGYCFEPVEPYFYPVLCESTDLPANDEYNSLFASGKLWTATEANVKTRVKMGVIKNLCVTTGTAPGVGQSVSLTLYLNGNATALVTTISDGAVTALNITDVIEVKDDDEVSVRCALTGGSASTDLGWSVAYRTYDPCVYSSREGNMGN